MDEGRWINARGLDAATLLCPVCVVFPEVSCRRMPPKASQIQAVTVQNEVDTDQDGRMPACSWPQEYEIGFVKNHLGPILQQNGLSTKIWILDHNYNLWGRAVAELDDPDLRKYLQRDRISRLRRHSRNDEQSARRAPRCADVLDRRWPRLYLCPTMRLIGRIGVRLTARPFATGVKRSPDGILRLMKRDVRTSAHSPVAAWLRFIPRRRRSLAADSTGRSRISRVMSAGEPRGSNLRVNCPAIEHVAFENPDGQKVLIVTNSGEGKTVMLSQAKHGQPICR